MTRRPAALDPVVLVARWTGYCLPCGDDDRALVLTWTGPRGLRAWLSGAGWADGALQLTCVCCGGVDVVGWEDEPEPVLAVEPVVEAAVEPVVVEPVAVEPVLVEPVLAAAEPVVRVVRVLDLDAPAPATVQTLAEVPPPFVPSRAERRAADRAARRSGRVPAPRGAADADALDLLHLVG